MRKTFGLGLLVAIVGCGGAVVQPPVAPGPTAATNKPSETTPATPSSNPWTLPDGPRDSGKAAAPLPAVKLDGWTKASKVKGLAPAPATCAAFAKRAPAAAAPKDLAAALVETDAAKRDALLVALEKTETVAGATRAVRAELAPVECGDAIVDPYLSAHPSPVGDGGHLLVGLSLAAKLSRTAVNVPGMKDAGDKRAERSDGASGARGAKPLEDDKEKVKAFIKGPLRTWMVEQATAIDGLSTAGAELAGYGRAVVAVEAGMADLRLVDRIRSAPTPTSWDKELKAVYEAALDEALEPRKARGRDAALVGLSDFAQDGVLVDARADRARALLSKLYGGRRVDALDALMLPGDPAAETTGASLLSNGSRARLRWLAPMNVPADAAPPSTRTRFELGRRYWWRVDFVEAAHAAAKDKDKDPNARLVLALALALAKGPNGVKDMMSAPSPSALGLNHTEALDALAAEGGKTGGMAAFDAAHLRSLAPPEGEAAAPYLNDVAARFRKAASLLEDPAQKKRAEERAADLEAAAKASEKK